MVFCMDFSPRRPHWLLYDRTNRDRDTLPPMTAPTGTDFGQYKETTALIYKQHTRSVWDYTSPVNATNLTTTHHKTMQTVQNKTLRIITGCTKTTPTNHLHYK